MEKTRAIQWMQTGPNGLSCENQGEKDLELLSDLDVSST